MAEKSRWVQKTEEDPNHSHWYVERMRSKAAEGEDLAGEARLIDAMVPRAARILDAGCGPGRVSAALASLGHRVVGVDVDPVLIAAAQQDFPGPTWFVGDLAELDLPGSGIDADFDVVVAAGNVMTFLAQPPGKKCCDGWHSTLGLVAASSLGSESAGSIHSMSSSAMLRPLIWKFNSS